jgi:RNA polymerase sigma-70 factor (ECF subfamily)
MESIAIAHVPDEEVSQEDQDRVLKLRGCIKDLNDADKALITLYLEELPYTEISSITGLSENHIAVKVKRIKTRLLNCMTAKL